MALKTALIWTIAVVITLASAVYQRMTGPTYPVSGDFELAGETVSFEMERTWEGDTDQAVSVEVPSEAFTGYLEWKRNKVEEAWTTVPMTWSEGMLIGHLPNQPPAGKLEYKVTISSGGEEHTITNGERAIVTRFKGVVPTSVLLPHVLFMFVGMLFSTRTGLEAIFKRDNLKRLIITTFTLLFIGGMILGPIVQKLAFGALWTGVPWGWDLTDNKTLLFMIAWGWALWAVIKGKNARGPALIASIATMLIYLIPHSVMGSEIDYNAEGML
ncbi:hypothetical protein ACFL6T_05795 [Candidatus Zixiibacteriota bacterium]